MVEGRLGRGRELEEGRRGAGPETGRASSCC
jgi:hypothetical protein